MKIYACDVGKQASLIFLDSEWLGLLKIVSQQVRPLSQGNAELTSSKFVSFLEVE